MKQKAIFPCVSRNSDVITIARNTSNKQGAQSKKERQSVEKIHREEKGEGDQRKEIKF